MHDLKYRLPAGREFDSITKKIDEISYRREAFQTGKCVGLSIENDHRCLLQLTGQVPLAVDTQNAIMLEDAVENVSHHDRRQHTKMLPEDIGIHAGFEAREERDR